MANSDPPVPQGLVAGKYRLTRLLGRGGMGAVWEGTHISLGTRVAVKFIDAEYANSPEARSRFENEARAAAKLRSKHVVEVYDHGVSDDGRPFIVMEFLQGEPLDKRLDRLGRLPAKETAQMVLQVCRALTKAHAAGIVHRDLKPENVFLVYDEEEGTDVVKVVDFGIAKFTDTGLTSSSATRTGSVLGTPHYMSPEQARGLRSVDYRSDLWSVAVIAYRCIVGTLPFDGEAVGDLLVKLCTAPIPVPSQFTPDIPPAFDSWLQKALNREPAQRFANASELAQSLAAVCGLSLRGHFMSAEMRAAQESGSGAYSAIGSGGYAAAGSGGYSATGSGPNPAYLGGAGSGSYTPQPGQPYSMPATGAPITQTPAPTQPRTGTGTGAIIAALIAALVVLGIGAAVAVKKLSASDATTAAAVPPSAPVTPASVAVAPPRPVVEPSPAPSAAPPASAEAVTKAPPVAVAKPATGAKPLPVPNKPLPKPPVAEKPKPSDIGF